MSASAAIPHSAFGLIGGSGTWGGRFPEDLDRSDVSVLHVYHGGFDTPFGQTAPFKLLQINDQHVLRVTFHGIPGFQSKSAVAPWIAAQQVAWCFMTAGVKRVIVDASVGGVQCPDGTEEVFEPWNIVIPDDFMMLFPPPELTQRSGTDLNSGRDVFPRMGGPFCDAIRQRLYDAARDEKSFASVYNHGVYACTRPDRYETAAEVAAYKQLGAHIVGQTLGYEAHLMRKLGICLGSLNIVSNVAEGVQWSTETPGAQRQFYDDCFPIVGNVVLNALANLISDGNAACRCRSYEMHSYSDLPVSDV